MTQIPLVFLLKLLIQLSRIYLQIVELLQVLIENCEEIVGRCSWMDDNLDIIYLNHNHIVKEERS